MKKFVKKVMVAAVVFAAGGMVSNVQAEGQDEFTRRDVTGTVVVKEKHWILKEDENKEYFITKRMRTKLKDFVSKQVKMSGLFKAHPINNDQEMLVGGKDIEIVEVKAENQ